MSLCLCFASQRGSSPVISFISPWRQLPRRKRFQLTRQIAPDAESARPDTVWKSRAFLTPWMGSAKKRNKAVGTRTKLLSPLQHTPPSCCCARVGGRWCWLTSCQACFGSKCLDTLPNEPIVCSGGVPLGGPRRRRGTKPLGSATMSRALNGGDRHRLPSGIQTPPQRPPAGCVSRKSKITKDSVRLKLCFPWVRGRGGASGIRQRDRQGCCAGFLFPPPQVIDERCNAY